MFNEQGSHDTELTHVECMSEAEKHLAEHAVDIILLDLGLPDAQGLAAVRRAHAVAPRVPLVVLTGLDDEALAAQALQEGAQDYLIKGQIEPRGLLRALRYAVERKAMEEALFVGKGTRPGHAQLHRRRRGLHRQSRARSPSSTVVAEKMTGWSLQEAAGRPLAEVFRILDAASREAHPESDGDGGWAQTGPRICRRIVFWSGATDLKFPSKTPLPRSTTARARLPAPSSFSAT